MEYEGYFLPAETYIRVRPSREPRAAMGHGGQPGGSPPIWAIRDPVRDSPCTLITSTSTVDNRLISTVVVFFLGNMRTAVYISAFLPDLDQFSGRLRHIVADRDCGAFGDPVDSRWPRMPQVDQTKNVGYDLNRDWSKLKTTGPAPWNTVAWLVLAARKGASMYLWAMPCKDPVSWSARFGRGVSKDSSPSGRWKSRTSTGKLRK